MGYVWFTGIFGKTTTGVETGVERTGETLGTRFIIESAYNDTSCNPANCTNVSIRNTGTELLDLTTMAAYIDGRKVPIVAFAGNTSTELDVGKTVILRINTTFPTCNRVLRITAAPQAESSKTVVC
jgi:hypothetical protein